MENINKDIGIGNDIRRFAETVSGAVSEALGGKCQVKLQEVIKNNGIILQGLVILDDRYSLSPTIYLNGFLDAYEKGVPVSNIVDRILEIYNEEAPKENIDMSFFRDFDKVSQDICYKLVSRSRNKALLQRIPHVDFLDLSICFYYSCRNTPLGCGSVLIHNSHADMWNCSVEALMKLAKKNTPRIYPCEVHGMSELLAEFTQTGTTSCAEDDAVDCIPMKVLTNDRKLHGASCMIYPKVLKNVAESVNDNLYILPSSIHEVILLPESEADDAGMLHDMIFEVNATQVEPEEILSDSLYFYNRDDDRIEIKAKRR